MIAKEYWVICDGNWGTRDHAVECPISPANAESTSQKARLAAKRQGWKRIVGEGRWDSRDLSPQCAAREEADR